MVGSEVDFGGRTNRTSQWFGYGDVGKEEIKGNSQQLANRMLS